MKLEPSQLKAAESGLYHKDSFYDIPDEHQGSHVIEGFMSMHFKSGDNAFKKKRPDSEVEKAHKEAIAHIPNGEAYKTQLVASKLKFGENRLKPPHKEENPSNVHVSQSKNFESSNPKTQNGSDKIISPSEVKVTANLN